MRVDLPSSTEPQVLKRRSSTGRWEWGIRELEVSLLLAVFHCGFAGLVVSAGAALGHARCRDFGDDVIDGVGGTFDPAGPEHGADGPDPANQFLHFFLRIRRPKIGDRQPLAVAANTLALVAEVNRR